MSANLEQGAINTRTSPPVSKRWTRGRRLFGIVPRRWRASVRSLVEEQERIGSYRPATTLTNHEAYVRSKGTAGSERSLRDSARRLEPVARKIDEIDAEMIRLSKLITNLDQTPLAGGLGETTTVIQAAQRQDELAARLQQVSNDGSRRHHRVAPNELRRLRRLTWVDYPVLLFFLASVFNVDWQALGGLEREGLVGNLVNLIFAAVFAFLGTRYTAIGLGGFGRFSRRLKNDQGHLGLPRGAGAVVWVGVATLSTSVVIGLSIVMAYRIVTEAEDAGVHGAGPLLLGVTYAAIVALINVLLIVRNFEDGSELTDQLDHLGTQLAPIRQQQHDLRQQIDRLEAVRAVEAGKTNRLAAVYRSKTSEPVQGADQLILLARGIHQGRGSEAAATDLGDWPPHGLLVPAPLMDTSPLDAVLARTDDHGHAPTGTTGVSEFPVAEKTDTSVTYSVANGKPTGHPSRVLISVDIEGKNGREGDPS